MSDLNQPTDEQEQCPKSDFWIFLDNHFDTIVTGAVLIVFIIYAFNR